MSISDEVGQDSNRSPLNFSILAVLVFLWTGDATTPRHGPRKLCVAIVGCHPGPNDLYVDALFYWYR